MQSRLPANKTNEIVNRLTLKQSFDFETQTSVQDCAKKLGWMHSEAQPGEFVAVRSRLSARVTPVSPDSYTFIVKRLVTTRNYESRITNTTSRFTAQGTLSANLETGGTRVTGDIQLAPMLVAGLGIAAIYLLILVIRGSASPLIAVIVLGVFAALAYVSIRDRNNLLQELHSL